MTYGDINTVRQLVGITEEDISDADLEILRQYAESLTLKRIAFNVFWEKAAPLNAERTQFQLKHKYIDPASVSVMLQDSDGNRYELSEEITITVDNWNGVLYLSAPIPADVDLYVTYIAFPRLFDLDEISKAVNYLTAHLATLRLENPDTLAISDLEKNALVIKKREDRFYKAYEAVVRALLGGKTFRAVSV